MGTAGAGSRLIVAARNLRGVRALTFDAFGSLLDGGPKDVYSIVASEVTQARAVIEDRILRSQWTEALDRHVRTDPFITHREVHSRALVEIFQRLGISRDIDGCLDRMDSAFKHARAYPEVRPVLQELEKEIPFAVISNTDTQPLLEALHRNGLDFTFVITSEEEQSYKPSLALFKRAIRYLGLPAANVLHVGDSYGEDIVGAAAAGVAAAFIARPGALREPPKDATPIAHDLNEVRDLIRRSWQVS